jgi:hypothetical protein
VKRSQARPSLRTEGGKVNSLRWCASLKTNRVFWTMTRSRSRPFSMVSCWPSRR